MEPPKNERDLRSQTKNAIEGLEKDRRHIARRAQPSKAGQKPLGLRVTRTNRRRWISERHQFICPICRVAEMSSRAWVVHPEVQCCKRCWTIMLEAMKYPDVDELLKQRVDWYRVCSLPIEAPPNENCDCRWCTVKAYQGAK